MKTTILTMLVVLLFVGCTPKPHARAIASLNEQIEKFNRRPIAIHKIKSPVADLKYDKVKKQVVCIDKQGNTILTLDEQPDGRFTGVLRSETVAPPNAKGHGHLFFIQEVQLGKEEFQPPTHGQVR